MVRPKSDDGPIVEPASGGLVVPTGWGSDFAPWPPRGLDEWLDWASTRPEPVWLIDGVLPSDAAVLISGQAKRAYKTWFAFQLAISLALGRSPVKLLSPVCQVDSLVIELEGPVKQTESRWRLLLAPYRSLVGTHIRYMHRYSFMLDNPQHLAAICELVHRENRRLVIIDTLAKSHSGDENSVRDVSSVMRHIDEVRKAMQGGTVIFIHHLRKPPDPRFTKHDGGEVPDIDSDIRGSSALAGFYDTHLAIRMASQHQAWLDLTVRSSDAEERYYQLSWAIDNKHDMSAQLDMKEMSAENISAEEAERFVGLLPNDESYMVVDLADIWQVNIEVAKAYRNHMLDNGKLEKVGKTGKVRRVSDADSTDSAD